MSLSDDDFLERLRSTTMADDQPPDSDDDGKLAQLRQLRGVWLALPDEEPPSTGLAQLMAAARTKAAELQPRPAWWRVVLATLRRPPVLALATVVVLVGGVVFVGRHHDAVESAEPIAPATTETRTRAPEGETTFKDRAESAGSANQPAPPATVDPVPPVSAPGVAPGPGATLKPAPVVVAPKPAPMSPAHHAVSKKPAPELDFESKQSNPSETPPPPPPELTKTGGALEKADDQVARPAAPRPDTADPNTTVERHAGKAASTPTATADQLYQQCQRAAASGDCARVRLLAAQVAKADATLYRDKLLKDAAVANCLK